MKYVSLLTLSLLFFVSSFAQNWTQQGSDIVGEAAYDGAGMSVSLSSDGSTVAIGAFGNDGNGFNAGHVRIYKNISGTWTQQGSDIDGESAGDLSGFGSPVSLSSDGSTVAIGAIGNDGNGPEAGHVRIYSLNSTNNIAVMPSKQVFYIYPNPSSNELNIKIESNLLGSKFRIINSLGQEIKQGELRSLSSAIDVSKLPKGNYFIQIGTENYSHQFLVE